MITEAQHRFAPRPPIVILGVPFANLTLTEAIGHIERMIASRRPHYLATANVDFLVQAQKDIELHRILVEADLVLCDGMPLVWASRLLGNPLPERVAGADLVPLLILTAAQKGYRLFLLGASPESAAQAVARLRAQYPQLVIAGHYSPPFHPLLEMDHEEIRRRILEARPDLLLVSFGCPKQEKWMAMHYRQLNVPVIIGVGATIDFLAGQVQRAPRWMQRTGTEWLFRLAQEPRRLFRRYAKDFWAFGSSFFPQWWLLQARVRWRRARQAAGAASGLDVPAGQGVDASGVIRSTVSRNGSEGAYQALEVPERIDLAAARQDPRLAEHRLVAGRHWLLEMGPVQFIDSTGLALLIRWQKRARAAGRQLVLLDPSPAVRRTLALAQLQDWFPTAPDLQVAQQLIQTREQERSATLQLTTAPAVEQSARPADSAPVTRQGIQPPAAATAALAWRGEITAVNAEAVWEATRLRLAALTNHPTHARGAEAASASIFPEPLDRKEEERPAHEGNHLQQPVRHRKGATVWPPPQWLIDLSELRFIDSSGLSVMVRLKKLARESALDLRFTNPQPAVRNVLDLAGLRKTLLRSATPEDS